MIKNIKVTNKKQLITAFQLASKISIETHINLRHSKGITTYKLNTPHCFKFDKEIGYKQAIANIRRTKEIHLFS